MKRMITLAMARLITAVEALLLPAAVALFASVVIVSAPTAAEADTCLPKKTVQNPCTPDALPNHIGTDNRVPEFRPTFCLSQSAFDLMTVAIQNGKVVRMPVVWDYGLYYGRGRAPEVFNTQVHEQCQTRQSLHPGTSVIVWFNCRDRTTGKWIRHWLATLPVHDNSTYVLVEYNSEEVSGYNDVPRKWLLPR